MYKAIVIRRKANEANAIHFTYCFSERN